MATWHSRAVLLSVLCGLPLAAGGCRKSPDAQAPPASPSPAATPTPAAAPTAAPVNAFLPAPDPADPLTWPVIVPVGKDGRALVPRVAARRSVDGSAYLRVGNGPQRLPGGSYAYTDSGGKQWYSPSAPPAPAGAGSGSQQRFGGDGSRSTYDADTGETETNHANGDYSVQDKDGSFVTLNSGGTHADGETASSYDAASDTFHHWFNDGRERVDNNNGGSITYPPGGAPDGKGGTPPPAFTPKAGGDKPGGGAGDPHYTTRDGLNYSPQQAGEFVLVGGAGAEHAVQARHQPWFRRSESVSVITALAVRAGGSRVEIRADGTALIDGRPAADGTFVQGVLPGGGAVGLWRQGGVAVKAVVVWPDLSALWVTIHGAGDGSQARGYLNFVTQWHALAPEHRGLLGSNDDNAANDLTDRGGNVLDARKADDLRAFVESWRVTDAESLFTYAPGESTATYTLKDFPMTAPNLAFRAQAEAAVAGLPPGAARDNCFYDIAATGDASFLAGYRVHGALFNGLTAAASRPPRKSLATPTLTPGRDAPTPARFGTGMTVTPQEMAAAGPIQARARTRLTLGAGESRVYKFTPNGQENQLAIRPYGSGDAGDYVAGKTAGYAWFDDQGKMFGEVKEAHQAWVAWWKPEEWRPTGAYYLKVVGPGDVEFELPF